MSRGTGDAPFAAGAVAFVAAYVAQYAHNPAGGNGIRVIVAGIAALVAVVVAAGIAAAAAVTGSGRRSSKRRR